MLCLKGLKGNVIQLFKFEKLFLANILLVEFATVTAKVRERRCWHHRDMLAQGDHLPRRQSYRESKICTTATEIYFLEIGCLQFPQRRKLMDCTISRTSHLFNKGTYNYQLPKATYEQVHF